MSTDQNTYVLVTMQPGAIGSAETNVYGPETDRAKLQGAGELLAAGASPPMAVVVLPLQPAKWGSL
jgi:hypothetical protein